MALISWFVNEAEKLFCNIKMFVLLFYLGDHEDAETDTSPQQQEETVQTEEPADLVTF